MMKVDNGLGSLLEQMSRRAGDSARQSLKSSKREGITQEEANDLVQKAQKNASNETMKTWDKHTDMVEKSQELSKIRDRREAQERRAQERVDNQRDRWDDQRKQADADKELMAKMAIENANREQLIEDAAAARRTAEMIGAA